MAIFRGLTILKLLLAAQLRAEWRQFSQMLAIGLFALVVIVLLAFAFAGVQASQAANVLMGEVFTAIFLALQLYLLRGFDLEMGDDAFTQLRMAPIAVELWYLAKLTHLVLMGTLVAVLTFMCALFFTSATIFTTGNDVYGCLIIMVLVLIGLCSLGALLAVMTMDARARHVLFPIIYFPLSVPVMISGVEGMRAVLVDHTQLCTLWGSWLGALAVFAAVFVVMGFLLYDELVGLSDK